MSAEIREAAIGVVDCYAAWAHDRNDGAFALWREPDLVNAITALRAALSSEDATRPTGEDKA